MSAAAALDPDLLYKSYDDFSTQHSEKWLSAEKPPDTGHR
jgi:hypothetical protein